MKEADDLVGLWDSTPFEYGSMEYSRVALDPDGSGWAAWANAAGGMALTTLTWRRLESDVFDITESSSVSGHWDESPTGPLIPDGPPVALDTVTRFRCRLVLQEAPLSSRPELTLELDQPLEGSTSYALV